MKMAAALLLPLGLAAAVPTAAQAAPETPAPEAAAVQQKAKGAYIPFADHGGVDNWQSEGESTVYFQDAHRRWYRATLYMPAYDLPYAMQIGIDAGPAGTLDKFGAVVIKGRRYPFRSFVAVDGPPAKHKAAQSSS